MKHQRNEEFEKAGITVAGGGSAGVMIARCGTCGEFEQISLGTRGRFPPDITARKFEARGWDCSDGRRGRDLCPECNPANKKKEKEKDMTKVTLSVVPTAPPALVEPVQAIQAVLVEPPPAMTRDDKRIIFAKLNDVYLNETAGYSAGWTDQRIADDLSVPRAWVSGIRDENFGPEAANEEIRTQLTEARAVLADVQLVLEKAEKLQTEAEASLKRQSDLTEAIKSLKGAADRVGKNVDRIHKALGV